SALASRRTGNDTSGIRSGSRNSVVWTWDEASSRELVRPSRAVEVPARNSRRLHEDFRADDRSFDRFNMGFTVMLRRAFPGQAESLRAEAPRLTANCARVRPDTRRPFANAPRW